MHDSPLRTERDALVAELVAAGGRTAGTATFCPFHDDRHPSLNVYRADDGIWRAKCMTPSCGFCGDLFDVRAKARGVPLADVLKEVGAVPSTAKGPPPTKKTYSLDDFRGFANLERMHVYTNPDTGKPDMIVLRILEPTGKTFRQASPNGHDGRFVLTAPPKPWPLYNRTRVRAASEVVVVEGEKKVEVLADVGIVATTSPGGAGNAHHSDWTPLAGKTVYLWADADPVDKKGKRTGPAHMADVLAILMRLSPVPTVYVIDQDALNLPPKGDAVDFLRALNEDGKTDEEKRACVLAVMERAKPAGKASQLWEVFQSIHDGTRKLIYWPWPILGKMSRALLPGTVTLICGAAGEGKSFWLLQAMQKWYCDGLKTATYELEEGDEHRMRRALAQREGDTDVLNDEWVKEHWEEFQEIWARNVDYVDGYSRTIWSAPDKQQSLDSLAEWVEARVADGCDIIAIDPISVAETTKEPWASDQKFIVRCKAAVRKSQSRLILVIHPKKNSTGRTLSDLSGGAAYARLVQTAFWIYRLKADATVTISTAFGPADIPCNWMCRIIKARNGPGQNAGIGYEANPKSMTFREIGLVLKEPKK